METAAAVSSSGGALTSSGRRRPSSLSRAKLSHRPTTGRKLIITPSIVIANTNSRPGPKDGDGSRHRGRRASPVDEFMPLLRARIRKVEVAEKLGAGSEGATAETDGWAEWERRYYLTGGYHRDVFGAVGALQTLLMDARPGVVIGALALVLLGLVATGITISASLADALSHASVLVHA